MAAITSREGVLIASNDEDTFSPQVDSFIEQINVVDSSGDGQVTIRKTDGTGPVIFTYLGDGATPGTFPFRIAGCCTTSKGLFFDITGDIVVYVYLR